MPAVTPDRDIFVRAIELTYQAALAPAAWPSALEAIAQCLGDVGTVLVYQREDDSYGTVVSSGLAAAQRDYEEEWWRRDIRMDRLVERNFFTDAATITDRHVVTEEECRTHPFYTEFLAPHGLGWFAAACLSPKPDMGVALSVQRAAARPRFSDTELKTISRLGQHVENAMRIGIRLIDAEMSRIALSDALSRLNIGVFMLDGAGNVVFSNGAGDALVGDSLLLVGNQLTARFEPERGGLRSANQAAATGVLAVASDRPRPVIVHGLDPERFVALYLLPVSFPADRAIDQLFAGVRVLVLAIPSKSESPPDPQIVRDLFGLTFSEARLAAIVGVGARPAEAADVLGITVESARTTLKQVFAKIGISRQSQLAALLARLIMK